MRTALERGVAKHPLYYAVASWFVLMFGFLLLVTWPGIRADHALEAATQAHQEQYAKLDQIVSALSLHGKWYVPELTEPVQGHVRQAERLFSEADGKLSAARQAVDLDDQYTYAKAAGDVLASCAQQLDASLLLFGQLQEERTQTRAQLAVARESLAAATTQLAVVRTTYDGVERTYLSTYRRAITGDLDQAQASYAEAERIIASAATFLPEDGSTAQIGSPTKGRILLVQADGLLTQGTTSRQAAHEAIELQSVAKRDAQPTISTAGHRAVSSLEHLRRVSSEHRLTADKALAPAFAQREQGLRELGVAEQAIATRVEGDQHDYVAAYTAAQRAIALFSDAVTSANTQATLRQEVLQSIALVERVVSETATLLNDAERSYTILESYHADSTWTDVRGNVHTGRTTLSRVRVYVQQASEYAGEQQQRFEEAKQALSSGNALLSKIRPLADAVTERKQALEHARSSWPSTQSNAGSTVASGARTVSSYGEYAPRTRTEIAEAKRLFEHAKASARDLDYAVAVSEANQAASIAASAGRTAENAYDDYREEQARIARAAQLAAEAAAAAANARPSDSVFGGGSFDGGSSYGGGRSDGGGYSAPSKAGDGYGW